MFAAASGKADLVVLSATDDEEGFSERVRGIVLNTAGVEDAIPSLQATVFMTEEDLESQRELSFLGESVDRLVVFGIDPAMDDKVREYVIVEGSFLPPDLDAYEARLPAWYSGPYLATFLESYIPDVRAGNNTLNAAEWGKCVVQADDFSPDGLECRLARTCRNGTRYHSRV